MGKCKTGSLRTDLAVIISSYHIKAELAKAFAKVMSAAENAIRVTIPPYTKLYGETRFTGVYLYFIFFIQK